MNGQALFGRYIERSSIIHRLDPRIKLLCTLMIIITILVAQSWWALLCCFGFIALFYGLASIGIGDALRSIAPLLFIVVITALLNVLFVNSGQLYGAWGPFTISEGGLRLAVFMAVRLVGLLLAASLLTLTTTNLDITEAFERLLHPFTRVGLPAHEMAMIMGIALRFLPQFATELQTIQRAQRSRGARMAFWPPHRGAQSIRSLFVPLFTSIFRHSETLSEAMESRCYHGEVERTRLHPLVLARRDGLAAIVVIAMLISVIVIDIVLG